MIQSTLSVLTEPCDVFLAGVAVCESLQGLLAATSNPKNIEAKFEEMSKLLESLPLTIEQQQLCFLRNWTISSREYWVAGETVLPSINCGRFCTFWTVSADIACNCQEHSTTKLERKDQLLNAADRHALRLDQWREIGLTENRAKNTSEFTTSLEGLDHRANPVLQACSTANSVILDWMLLLGDD